VTKNSQRKSKLRESHHQERLCLQVAEIISLSLGDSADSRLHDVLVESVVPTPDGARLLVLVKPTGEATPEQLDELYVALEGARGWLRAQVAGEIHRKRTPDLQFRVLPPWEDDR